MFKTHFTVANYPFLRKSVNYLSLLGHIGKKYSLVYDKDIYVVSIFKQLSSKRLPTTAISVHIFVIFTAIKSTTEVGEEIL